MYSSDFRFENLDIFGYFDGDRFQIGQFYRTYSSYYTSPKEAKNLNRSFSLVRSMLGLCGSNFDRQKVTD